jgi:hypothetical protein
MNEFSGKDLPAPKTKPIDFAINGKIVVLLCNSHKKPLSSF